MNVVDTSGWLAYFAGEPNAKHFAPALQAPQELVVPTVTLYEVFKVVLREASENAALQAVAAMQKGTVVDLTPALALAAGKLSLRHALPMADAIILATARVFEATLWTQDSHFKGIDGVKLVAKR
ncbi:MAG: type II toxin-antitoxin system VapC family toxin [bacterium]